MAGGLWALARHPQPVPGHRAPGASAKMLEGLLLSVMVLRDLLHQPLIHTALLQSRGKKINEVSISDMFGAVANASPPHAG